MIRKALILALFVPMTGCVNSDCGSATCASKPSPLTVFAAASLRPFFDAYAAKRKSRYSITFNYAGTQTLTAQLEQGAQADVFASADRDHMQSVEQAGLLGSYEPQVFAHNRLEIAVARGNPKGIHSLQDLSRPGVVVVLADPSVPAGKYARQALAKAHVTVHPASLELDVTAVLNKVALGDADAGIVYVSDVTTSHGVDGVSIPDDQNVIADYLIAPLKESSVNYTALSFVDEIVHQAAPELSAAGFEAA